MLDADEAIANISIGPNCDCGATKHDTWEHSTMAFYALIVPVRNRTRVSDFRKCWNVHVHTAPQIVKIESRFITTIDVVHYLALLARLFICTHSYTRSRTHIGLHQLTYTITQSHIHSESHTRTLLHTITT